MLLATSGKDQQPIRACRDMEDFTACAESNLARRSRVQTSALTVANFSSEDAASERSNRYLGEQGVASVREEDKGSDEGKQHPRRRERHALPGDAAMGMDSPHAATPVAASASGVHASGHLRGRNPRGSGAVRLCAGDGGRRGCPQQRGGGKGGSSRRGRPGQQRADAAARRRG